VKGKRFTDEQMTYALRQADQRERRRSTRPCLDGGLSSQLSARCGRAGDLHASVLPVSCVWAVYRQGWFL